MRFRNVKTVLQKEQKGTGHALLQALPKLNRLLPTLVLYGDVPLCSKETLKKLVRLSDGAVGLLTHRMQNPHGYGRIVRDIDPNAALREQGMKDWKQKRDTILAKAKKLLDQKLIEHLCF